jgi:hypothetical protein
MLVISPKETVATEMTPPVPAKQKMCFLEYSSDNFADFQGLHDMVTRWLFAQIKS